MSKTTKIRQSSSKKNRSLARKLKAAKMGVPTIAQRLAMIDRSILVAAASLGVDYDEMSSINPNVRPVSLMANEVSLLVKWLSVAYENAWHLSQTLPSDVQSEFSPSHDQKEAFEPIEIAVGAR